MLLKNFRLFFYGWWVVAAAFITLFVATGFIFYSYGVFMAPIQKEFGASRFAVAIGLTLMNSAMAFVAPFLGRFIDTWSIRRLMMMGCVSLGIGFFLGAHITALWQFYLLIGTFLAFGVSSIGQLSSTALVSNWFIRRRGAALGIATTGVSMSGMVMAPVTSYFVDTYGWRDTFLIFGAIAVCGLLPLVWLLIIGRPEDIGVQADGVRPSPIDEAVQRDLRRPLPRSAFSFSTAATLRKPTFWAITLCIGFNFFAMAATLIHIIEYARDLGITRIQASYVLTISAGIGVIGKVLFGFVADYVDARLALLLCLAFQAVATLLFIPADTYRELMIAGAVFGFGMGGVVPLWGSLVGDYFPRPVFGRVMGLMTPCMLPIQASGVPIAGLIHDATGNYHYAFISFVASYACAATCLLFVRDPVSGPVYERQQALLRAAIPVAEPAVAPNVCQD